MKEFLFFYCCLMMKWLRESRYSLDKTVVYLHAICVFISIKWNSSFKPMIPGIKSQALMYM